MERVPLLIVNIEQSPLREQSYVLVLKERQGFRQFSIFIGMNEARSIAIALEEVDTKRPFTHDLIWSMFQSFGFTLVDVTITKVKEGIFYSVLNCLNESTGEQYVIDSRTSDAIALAVRFNCPILINETILEQVGHSSEVKYIEIEEEDLVDVDESSVKLERLPTTKLKELITELLDDEKYEEAARIRDEILRRQSELDKK